MQSIALQIQEKAKETRGMFHRLVVVVGPSGCGKTNALQQLQEEKNWPLLNLSQVLSEKLLDLTIKQRRLRTAEFIREIIEEQRNQTVTMLDNIGLLFHPALQQEPMMALQRASRNRTVIAAWQGEVVGNKITYGSPEHPEYQRIDLNDIQTVTAHSSGLAGA